MPRRYSNSLPETRPGAPPAAPEGGRARRIIEQPVALPVRRRAGRAGADRAPHDTPGREADTIPRSAGLTALRKGADRCRDCPIGEHATQAVFGEGPPGARLMLVGEQPGDQEDRRGQPFVGPAGALLDKALGELGWSRDQLFVTNAVKHFKFEMRGKRRMHKTPAQREVDICYQWLERELALVRPEAVVALGATAARALMGRPVAVTRERGQWLARADGLRVLVTLHPSALLRGPSEMRAEAFERWLEDLRRAAEYVDAQ